PGAATRRPGLEKQRRVWQTGISPVRLRPVRPEPLHRDGSRSRSSGYHDSWSSEPSIHTLSQRHALRYDPDRAARVVDHFAGRIASEHTAHQRTRVLTEHRE